jgi:hypothetical protein
MPQFEVDSVDVFIVGWMEKGCYKSTDRICIITLLESRWEKSLDVLCGVRYL